MSIGKEYWQRTQQVLQSKERPMVLKPYLHENLLIKPPFRFIHDVISEVIRNTGFASGLYSGIEADSRSFQGKEGKILFLEKIIDVVSIVLRQEVPARASKIVAGLEPENTNTFLQMLGLAARQYDGEDAVEVVLQKHGQQQQTQHKGAREAIATNLKGQSSQMISAALCRHSREEIIPVSGLHNNGQSGDATHSDSTPHCIAPVLNAIKPDQDDNIKYKGVEQENADKEIRVTFERAHNLLPQLTLQMQEVHNILKPPAKTKKDIWQLCNHVKTICQDAVLISKCIESLQTLMDALIKEGSFWSQEASKMEQHLMDEERIFQESRICWEEKIRKLQDKFVSNYNDA